VRARAAAMSGRRLLAVFRRVASTWILPLWSVDHPHGRPTRTGAGAGGSEGPPTGRARTPLAGPPPAARRHLTDVTLGQVNATSSSTSCGVCPPAAAADASGRRAGRDGDPLGRLDEVSLAISASDTGSRGLGPRRSGGREPQRPPCACDLRRSARRLEGPASDGSGSAVRPREVPAGAPALSLGLRSPGIPGTARSLGSAGPLSHRSVAYDEGLRRRSTSRHRRDAVLQARTSPTRPGGRLGTETGEHPWTSTTC
jgi:hypothetical protein